jgi:hypothetical protein
VRRLTDARIESTFNFYRNGAGALLRRERLLEYLESRRRAGVLLVGEAAGYRGARVSGLPFTSERHLTGTGPAEASATVVQRVLADLGVEHEVLLWNVVPTHPHRDGVPESNRHPTRAEAVAGLAFAEELAAGRYALAVGRLAERALGSPYVRHPSRGGAEAFRAGLMKFLDA